MEKSQLAVCSECWREWDDIRERWLAFIAHLDELVYYCPDCAAREFGGG